MSTVPDEFLIATIPSSEFYVSWTERERDACREWMRANWLDPNDISIGDPVTVHVVDCGLISFTEFVRDDETGHVLRDRDGAMIRRTTVALRVPLPDPATFPVVRP